MVGSKHTMFPQIEGSLPIYRELGEAGFIILNSFE